MTKKIISNRLELIEILDNNIGVLCYFSRNTCNVGEVLEPKIRDLIQTNFPKILFCFIDMDKTPEISEKYNISIEPTILVFFDKKETIRKSRNFSVIELSDTIKRIYTIIFE